MIAIRNYNDTKIELHLAKIELNRLIDKKERIYSKHFSTTTRAKDLTKDVNANLPGTHIKSDPMTDYLAEMQQVNEITGTSLETDLLRQQNEVGVLEAYLRIMDYDMAQLKGIEYQLYYDIVINPSNVNKSISKIVEEFSEKEGINKEPNTIWTNYYPKIKKYLEKLAISSENQAKDIVK